MQNSPCAVLFSSAAQAHAHKKITLSCSSSIYSFNHSLIMYTTWSTYKGMTISWDKSLCAEAQQWKTAFIPTCDTLWNTLVLARGQWTDVLRYRLNSSRPPLAWESTSSHREGVNEKELSLLSLSSPLAPLKFVIMLQDAWLGAHNCTGHYSSEDSRGDRLINQAFVLQFRKRLFLQLSAGSLIPRVVRPFQMYNRLQSGHPPVSITIW